jgi:hypothetical protein
MKNHHIFLVLTLLLWAVIAPGAALANSFSGQATVVQATVLGFPKITLADTEALPPEGGSKDATLLAESVPGLLSAQVLHATAVAMGDASRSEASVANLNLTVAGNTISANFLMARAAAFCGQGNASASGSSELAVVGINGQTIVVTGNPGQTIALPGGGQVIINEQSQNVQGNKADMTVNALHVQIPGIADVIIASAHADITCTGKTCPLDKDFVTGGGWITNGNGRATFAVAGGMKNGGGWGHLTYIDHGSGMKVKGTGVTDYIVTGLTTRQIKGTCEINGNPNNTYIVDVDDQGEPGRDDTFYMQLSNEYRAGGKLEGGNIQLHTCK